MDERTDPIEIVARVGGVVPFTDRERALGVWMHLATKAGWQVTSVSGPDQVGDSGTCGVVDVEGIQYLILLGPRVRRALVEVIEGRMTQRPVLGFAAWAEPVLAAESAPC
jgi:hypothetical protein